MLTLENEFEQHKAAHKYAILKARIIQYYKDLEAGQVLVPDFQRIGQRPEDLADRDLKELILRPDGLKKFNELYEHAYQDIAEVLT